MLINWQSRVQPTEDGGMQQFLALGLPEHDDAISRHYHTAGEDIVLQRPIQRVFLVQE